MREVAAYASDVSSSSQVGLSRIRMRRSAGTDRQICRQRPAKIDSVDTRALVDFLRNRFPTNTIHNVSAKTGIPSGTVENWICGKSKPSISHLAELTKAFGLTVIATIFPFTFGWLDEAIAAEEGRRLDAEIEALQEKKRRLFNGRETSGRNSG